MADDIQVQSIGSFQDTAMAAHCFPGLNLAFF